MRAAGHVLALVVVLGVVQGCCRRCEEPEAKRTGAAKSAAAMLQSKLLLTLPDYCNTPDGCTLTDDGDIILSVPNFNNPALLEAKEIDAPAPALMVKIDPANQVSKWYEFARKDLHPDTGKVGPMGCDIGPDGNLYVADNQFFFDPAHKSRLLRINIENGKAVSCDVVVEGFVVANAAIWHGNTVYVSETVLSQPAAVAAGEERPPLHSGVYAINMSEWENGPVRLRPWSPKAADPHLIASYKTSGQVGFGADGLTFDGQGNLYCGIFEDGVIYRTTFSPDGPVKQTSVFAKTTAMACCDGIFWRAADNRIYVADMLLNAVQVVDMTGAVTTLHRNGDTTGADGSLDQPCEVLVRGNELIVVNMDMPWDSPLLTNKKIDRPFTLSVLPLPPAAQ